MLARIAVLASGNGSNLQAILDHLQAQGDRRSADVVLVISNRDDAFALERARRNSIDAHFIRDDDPASLLRALEATEVDLVVLAGYLRMLPPEVIARYRNRILNIHPAPLPQFGGPGMYGERVHAAVIASGVENSAATVHLVNEEYDRGPVIAQWPVPVQEHDTPGVLAQRVLEIEHMLYPRVIDMVAALLTSNMISTI